MRNKGFGQWLASQFFWHLKPSGSSKKLSFELGKSPLLFWYGVAAIAFGVYGFYVAFTVQPLFFPVLQSSFTSGAYMEMLKTYLGISLLFVPPSLMILFGTWPLGFRGILLIDSENLFISKHYSFFKFPLRSRIWSIKDLRAMSICSYGKGIVSARIHQLRLVAEEQPWKAILTCSRAHSARLSLLAEQIASFLNVPLSSN
jgi:hypothetical protein